MSLTPGGRIGPAGVGRKSSVVSVASIAEYVGGEDRMDGMDGIWGR
jgi:hypothetical protein